MAAGATLPETDAAYAHCLRDLRTLDRDRYLALLLMPADRRAALAALFLFNAEIARIRDLASEPLAGEIRLQWWRDVLAEPPVRPAAGHPLAETLIDTIERFHLPPRSFEAYLEARLFDLYDDPMPDRASFEGYAGETASTILQLSAMILDGAAAPRASEAAGHAGVAQAVAGTLLLMPRRVARGQVYVPGDILAACGLDRDAFLGAAEDSRLRAVGAALVAYGQEHLAKARAAAGAMPPALSPAFLPVALAAQVLEQAAKRPDRDPRRTPPELPQWRRQWRLFRAARSGRF